MSAPASPTDDLGAVLRITRAVAMSAPLPSTLSMIARLAAERVDAEFASILLLDGPERLRFAAGHGFTDGYRGAFRTPKQPMPSWTSLARRCPIAVPDTESHPLFAPWRDAARREGYRAMLVVPLVLGDEAIGTLDVYRVTPGEWGPHAVGCLELLAAHVAAAVRTAELIDEQKHRVAALSRVVRGLRDQRQTHVVQLQTMSALLDRSDLDGMQRLVSVLEAEHHDTFAAISERVRNRILAGTLIAEMSIAAERGVRLRIDRRSRLDAIPARLSEPEVVSIISNLLDNAFDAVAPVGPGRRRVTLLLRHGETDTLVRARDWGVGLTEAQERLLAPGFTTKPGHTGTGLALVAQIARGAGGSVQIEPRSVGAAVTVVVPNG
jgi:GAF domain-containing protein